jgi:hypothetical protein
MANFMAVTPAINLLFRPACDDLAVCLTGEFKKTDDRDVWPGASAISFLLPYIEDRCDRMGECEAAIGLNAKKHNKSKRRDCVDDNQNDPPLPAISKLTYPHQLDPYPVLKDYLKLGIMFGMLPIPKPK